MKISIKITKYYIWGTVLFLFLLILFVSYQGVQEGLDVRNNISAAAAANAAAAQAAQNAARFVPPPAPAPAPAPLPPAPAPAPLPPAPAPAPAPPPPAPAPPAPPAPAPVPAYPMLVSAVSQDVLKSNSAPVPAPTTTRYAIPVIQARPAWTEADEAAEQGSSYVPIDSGPTSTSKASIIQASVFEPAPTLAPESTVGTMVAANSPQTALAASTNTATAPTAAEQEAARQAEWLNAVWLNSQEPARKARELEAAREAEELAAFRVLNEAATAKYQADQLTAAQETARYEAEQAAGVAAYQKQQAEWNAAALRQEEDAKRRATQPTAEQATEQATEQSALQAAETEFITDKTDTLNKYYEAKQKAMDEQAKMGTPDFNSEKYQTLVNKWIELELGGGRTYYENTDQTKAIKMIAGKILGKSLRKFGESTSQYRGTDQEEQQAASIAARIKTRQAAPTATTTNTPAASTGAEFQAATVSQTSSAIEQPVNSSAAAVSTSTATTAQPEKTYMERYNEAAAKFRAAHAKTLISGYNEEEWNNAQKEWSAFPPQ